MIHLSLILLKLHRMWCRVDGGADIVYGEEALEVQCGEMLVYTLRKIGCITTLMEEIVYRLIKYSISSTIKFKERSINQQ